MVLRYAAKRPAEEYDGMQQHEDDFIKGEPDIVAVVIMTRHRRIEESGTPVFASTKVKHIEPVEGADADQVRKILAAAYSRRTGNEQLPFDEFEGIDQLPIDGPGAEQ